MTHAQVRARERYGLDVYTADFRDIENQITNGEAKKVGIKGRTTSIYEIVVQGIAAVIVYNRRTKFVITFLPIDWMWSR